MWSNRAHVVAAAICVAVAGSAARAQVWDVFQDDQSASVCDVVNVSNAELVVLSSTGELVIVTGTDVILEDTYVDGNNNVFYLDDPVGFIEFATDGDGLGTVWWLSLTGNVVEVDGFTGEPFQTDLLPSDFQDVPCDACDFWDDPTACTTVVVDDPTIPGIPVTINFCGAGGAATMMMTLMGLSVMGLARRRRI